MQSFLYRSISEKAADKEISYEKTGWRALLKSRFCLSSIELKYFYSVRKSKSVPSSGLRRANACLADELKNPDCAIET